ncbi:MAG: hypothetical protein A3K19_15905 [Lentisphaerae bacterium RIFOXYB12_FULL_65_16]|nr:MAG: hypothetical protein A3K18_06050 [Lentisphaerae bacterium RIFOXYA12_64_32]OGV87309.1 MAG: hypothetical protein A3K19_15905 [Lentisphaerae bacterium RIFOXYB12_FULL_65_16]
MSDAVQQIETRGAESTYHLLTLDIDGTFVNSKKEVTPAVRDAVRGLVQRKFAVTFATGRMFEAVRPWAMDLGLQTPLICNNGADIVEPGSGRRVASRPLGHEAVAWLLDHGREQDLTTILFCGPRVLGWRHTTDDWLIERNRELVEAVPIEVLGAATLTVEKLLYLDRHHPERLEAMRDRLNEVARTRGRPFVAQISEPGILNFSHPEATKPHALVTLCRILGITPAQVIAIGDGDNDAAILAAAGLGIAMGNATPQARAAARIQVPDNDHDGVAVAIQDIILPLLGEGGLKSPGPSS